MAMQTPIRIGQRWRSKLQPSFSVEVTEIAEALPYCTAVFEPRIVLKDAHGQTYHCSKIQLQHYYNLASIVGESVPKSPYPHPANYPFETETA